MSAGAKIVLKIHADQITKEVKDAVFTGMWDIADDLQRTASANAPHWKGTLEKSWAKDVYWENNSKIGGFVSYSVRENPDNPNWNGFNYALKMHEDFYNLGEGSRAKPGGIGMSGRRYPVGRRYLMNVVEGERETYQKHVQSLVNKAVK